MHIRYNETLLQYEYSQTGTDTGPWTKLDLSANVGTLPANIAYKDQANIFTQDQTINKVPAELILHYPEVFVAKGGIGKIHPHVTICHENIHYTVSVGYSTIDPTRDGYFAHIYSAGGIQFYRVVAGTTAPIQILDIGPTALTVVSGRVGFPAAQVNSGNPNHLDDYEEGTFTPTLNGVGLGYATQQGQYTKIGRLVIWQMRIILSSLGSSSGAIFLNLPFVQPGPVFGAGFLGHFAGAALGGGGWFCFLGYIGASNGDLRFTNSALTQVSQMTYANITAGFDMIMSGTMMTDT